VWGLLLAFLVIAVGVFAGIRSGLNTRLAAERGKRLELAAEYFNYGIDSMNQGNYELAKSQFMYVNDLVPGFPGLIEKLTEVEMKLTLKLTPYTYSRYAWDWRDVQPGKTSHSSSGLESCVIQPGINAES
jgi:hypothetical protein